MTASESRTVTAHGIFNNIDNERQDLEEDETYEVEDDYEITIETCNELIISLFKKADERKEAIRRVIARVAAEVHKELHPNESLDD